MNIDYRKELEDYIVNHFGQDVMNKFLNNPEALKAFNQAVQVGSDSNIPIDQMVHQPLQTADVDEEDRREGEVFYDMTNRQHFETFRFNPSGIQDVTGKGGSGNTINGIAERLYDPDSDLARSRIDEADNTEVYGNVVDTEAEVQHEEKSHPTPLSTKPRGPGSLS